MKRAKVIVLAIAITAAIGAAWQSIVSRTPEVKQVEKTVAATDMLVAAKSIDLG